MPGQPQQNRAIAAVVIVVVLLDGLGNGIVDLLIVLKLRQERLAILCCSGQIKVLRDVVTSSTEGTGSKEIEESIAAATAGGLWLSSVGVGSSRLLAEGLADGGESGVGGGGSQSAGERADEGSHGVIWRYRVLAEQER